MDIKDVNHHLGCWHSLNELILSEKMERSRLQAEITELDSKCMLWTLLNHHKIKLDKQSANSHSDNIQRIEILIHQRELSLLANTGILYRQPTSHPSYSAQTYHDEIECLGNDVPTLLELLKLSMNTDPVFIDFIQEQDSCTRESYWAHAKQQYPRLDGSLLPPSQWGYECSKQAYEKNQVVALPRETRLLRTLQYGETISQRTLLDFKEGQEIWIGPGLSTTVTKPFKPDDILWSIRGVKWGVPIVGTWDNLETGYRHNYRNENEVFIPDQLKCRVIATSLNPDDELKYRNDKIFQLQVIDYRTPDHMYTGCE